MSARVTLRKGRARPFWFRHPWVFSGAVHRVEGEPADGSVVELHDHDGRFVGRGFYNGASQIRVRVCTWDSDEPVDAAFFQTRIDAAIALRRRIGLPCADTDGYRLVHGEGDGLPGLIVDVFGRVASVQFSSRGLHAFEEPILDLLEDRLDLDAIVERPSRFSLRKEGVTADGAAREARVRRSRGDGASGEHEGRAAFRELGISHEVDLLRGQKTGFYFDQRENRALFASLVRGARVYDGFCYTGAFALAATVVGEAREVVAVDSSEAAIAIAHEAAARNGGAPIELEVSDVADSLRERTRRGERFDAVAIDPPKLCPTRGDLPRAAEKYRDLNRMAIRATAPGGLLATSSCSGHLHPDEFVSILNDASRAEGRTVRVLYRRTQGPDHPVVTSCPESDYLKFVIGRVE